MSEKKSWIDLPRELVQPVLPGFEPVSNKKFFYIKNPRPNSSEYRVVENLPNGQSRIFSVKMLEESRKSSNWNWKTKQDTKDCQFCPFHLEYENEINGERIFYETCELGKATKLLYKPNNRRHCALINNPWMWYERLRYKNVLNQRELEFIVLD